MNADPTNRQSRPPWRACTVLVAAVFALLLGACVSKPYRTVGVPCAIKAPQPDGNGGLDWEAAADGSRPCADRWQVLVEKPVPFSMNFVEVDEQGILASRDQAEAALANAAKDKDEDSYVIVFVHGWHHNASSEDANVKGFYDALALVSRWNPKRKIKGIYVGWRGDSLPVPGLRYLTFWDRKNTSDEVGRGGLLEFLLRLEKVVKPDRSDRNRLVVVGHSFGASVTFNALAHLHMQRFLDGVHSTADGPRFRGYGDMVVLINPAIEAMRYMPLQSALDYYASRKAEPRLDFSHETRPVLLILSSQGDWATRKAFPAARLLSTALEAHANISAANSPAEQGPYSEWAMDRDAVGNFGGFLTHAPLLLSDPTADAKTPVSKKLTENCAPVSAAEMWQRLNQTEESGAAFPDSQLLVRRIAKPATLGSPYIVAPVSARIIRDHTDIGSPNLVCWINQLLDTREDKVRTLLTSTDPEPGTAQAAQSARP